MPCGGGGGVELGERRWGTSGFCGVCPGTSVGISTGEAGASGVMGVVAIGVVCDRGDIGGAMTCVGVVWGSVSRESGVG